MAVKNHGLEVLKLSAEQVVSGSDADYFIKTSPYGKFKVPPNADKITVTYPTSFTQVFKFYTGVTLLGTVTLTYAIAITPSLTQVVAT